jgi:hypothetical protein
MGQIKTIKNCFFVLISLFLFLDLAYFMLVFPGFFRKSKKFKQEIGEIQTKILFIYCLDWLGSYFTGQFFSAVN